MMVSNRNSVQQTLPAPSSCLLLPPPLTVSLARQVFFVSFSLSQGQPTLQHDLFRALAQAFPHWRLSKEMCGELVGLAPAVRKLAERGVHAGFTHPVEEELVEQVAKLAGFLNDPLDFSQEDVLKGLLAGFIRCDQKYLCTQDGRPRTGPEADSRAPCYDTHFSFVCHYLLLSHKTGCWPFDRVLARMSVALMTGGAVLEWLRKAGCLDALAEVVVAHNQWHPEAQVPLPEGQISEAE